MMQFPPAPCCLLYFALNILRHHHSTLLSFKLQSGSKLLLGFLWPMIFKPKIIK
jgi:hypothetical protein